MYQLRRVTMEGRDKILCEVAKKERILSNPTYAKPEYNQGAHYIVMLKKDRKEFWETREIFKSNARPKQ